MEAITNDILVSALEWSSMTMDLYCPVTLMTDISIPVYVLPTI